MWGSGPALVACSNARAEITVNASVVCPGPVAGWSPHPGPISISRKGVHNKNAVGGGRRGGDSPRLSAVRIFGCGEEAEGREEGNVVRRKELSS